MLYISDSQPGVCVSLGIREQLKEVHKKSKFYDKLPLGKIALRLEPLLYLIQSATL